MRKSTLRYLAAAIWLPLGCFQLWRSHTHWHQADRSWLMPLVYSILAFLTCALTALTARIEQNAEGRLPLPPSRPTA